MRKKFYYAISLILVISIFYNLCFYLSNRISKVKKEKILKIIGNTNNQVLALDNGLEVLKRKYQNEDIVGYLEILNEEFVEPLVQTTDNSYYLNHLINKAESSLGSTYIDSGVNQNSNQIIIYSNSSTSYNMPFNILSNYLDEEYFNKHKILKLNYLNKEEFYEIFSVYITTTFEQLQTNFLNHIKILIENSIYSKNIDFSSIDKIIVLQTPYNGNDDGVYLVVCGKKIL